MPTINDLVILGRACPEPLKDGRVTVCLAGWSATFGFVRLYPTRFDMLFKQWDVIKVDVELNERDTRLESWKILGSKNEWESLAQKAKVTGNVDSPNVRRNILGNLTDNCVMQINNEKRSLGIVQPTILQSYFKDNDDYHKLFQLGLPDLTELDEVMVKRDFPQEPRLIYRCPECLTSNQQHDQQVLEWGFYEWIRKNPDKKEQVWENAKINDPDYNIYLLVGNQARYRNSFMVISVLRVAKGNINIPLFPYLKWTEE